MRIGAPRESGETLFQGMMGFGRRDFGDGEGAALGWESLWRVTLEWSRIEAKEPRETDAAGSGAKWMAMF